MQIFVNAQVRLSEFHSADKPALIEHLQEKEIYDRTLRIPYPYMEEDADQWLSVLAKMTQQQGRPVAWAIRDAEDFLIGSCGFDGFQLGKSHRAEIGYWLAKPYWNRGIATAVVGRACQHAFEQFGLVKITAHVFARNPTSARVLEKCGFEQEGYLKRHYVKDGEFLDARLFALVK